VITYSPWLNVVIRNSFLNVDLLLFNRWEAHQLPHVGEAVSMTVEKLWSVRHSRIPVNIQPKLKT
tara:strand:- start:238 stop:432 length:195 start_codon:yes stop_codon:yes gene_type:complete